MNGLSGQRVLVLGLGISGRSAASFCASQGVEVVAGDFTDRDSLVRAATGVDAIYAMSTPFEQGMDAEKRDPINFGFVDRHDL